MNDDQYLLANAYFDGALTGEERRIAEADPDVMSEVDRLRSLQSLLRDSDLPSASARTAAISAAMAEFAMLADAVRTTTGTTTAGTVSAGRSGAGGTVTTSLRRRPSYSRYLAVAAAVAAIGAAGVVVAGVIGNGSDDDSSSADLAISTETLANVDPDVSRSASATTLAAAVEMAPTLDQALAESAPTESTAAESEGAASPATTAAGEVATGSAATAMGDATEMTMTDPAFAAPYPTSGGPVEPIADRDQTITNRGQLAGLGVLLAALRDDGELGATPETSCLVDDASVEIVDETSYRFPDGTREVLVALVAGGIDGHTLAIDPDSCTVLVVGP